MLATLTIDTRFPDDLVCNDEGDAIAPAGQAFSKWVQRLIRDNGGEAGQMLQHEMCNWEFNAVLDGQAMYLHTGQNYDSDWEEDEAGQVGPWDLMIDVGSFNPFRSRSARLHRLAEVCVRMERLMIETGGIDRDRLSWILFVDKWFGRPYDARWDPHRPLEIGERVR